tara:strand:- start:130 stop:507 length:378 start_codon:yes stop_codon:yes gene_type:complete
MSIQITSGQFCTISGTFTVDGFQRQPDQAIHFRAYRKTETLDYWPFAIIQTDNETFMSIEALEHDDNVYPAGKKVFGYDKAKLTEWRAAFEYMRPLIGRWGTGWKNPAPRIYDCRQLLKNKGAKQ